MYFLLLLLCIPGLCSESSAPVVPKKSGQETIIRRKTGPAPRSAFIRIGGQISPVFAHYSQGRSGSMFGTLGSSNNRIFFWHATHLPYGIEARGTIELGFNLQSTHQTHPWATSENIDLRKCYISFLSEGGGSIIFGKIKTATEDSAEQDCSFAPLSIPALIAGVPIRNINIKGDAPKFSQVYNNFDGSGRAIGIRYDSPLIIKNETGGVGIRADLHNAVDLNDEQSKVVPGFAVFGRFKMQDQNGRSSQIRFASGTTKIFSRVGSVNTSGIAWSNSASTVLPCGTGFTAVFSRLFYSQSAFPQAPFFALGKISQWFYRTTNPIVVSVEYGTGRNIHPFGGLPKYFGRANVFGISAGQSFPKYGIDAFIAWKHLSYTLDESLKSNLKFESTNLIIAGVRIVF